MMILKKERRLNVETTQKKVSSCIKYNMESNKNGVNLVSQKIKTAYLCGYFNVGAGTGGRLYTFLRVFRVLKSA